MQRFQCLYLIFADAAFYEFRQRRRRFAQHLVKVPHITFRIAFHISYFQATFAGARRPGIIISSASLTIDGIASPIDTLADAFSQARHFVMTFCTTLCLLFMAITSTLIALG